MNPFTNGQDIIWRLVRTVRNADAAGKIDEADGNPRFMFDFHGQFKKLAGQFRIIFIGHGIAGKEGMDAKLLGALLLEDLEGFHELGLGHPIFGVARIIHDVIAKGKGTARIIAATNCFRDTDETLYRVNHGKVIKVDDGSQFSGQAIILVRCII